MKNFYSNILSIFEKIAVIRTRQALQFLSDNELKQLGISRDQINSGNFYKPTSRESNLIASNIISNPNVKQKIIENGLQKQEDVVNTNNTTLNSK